MIAGASPKEKHAFTPLEHVARTHTHIYIIPYMNNLYYGFRGDPGQRVPSHPQSAIPSGSASKEQQRDQGVQLVQTVPVSLSSSSLGLQPGGPGNPGIAGNPTQNGSVRYAQNNNAASANIPFASQPWAPDLPSSQSQMLPHHSLALSHQQQVQQHQQHQAQQDSSPVGRYQAHQAHQSLHTSLRPSALGASNAAGGSRGGVQMPSRQTQNTQYDDSMYHMMNKSFQDNASGLNGPLSTTAQLHPDSVLTGRLHQHPQQQTIPHSQPELFARHPQHIAGSSAVFDPSEFPTLGGASSNQASSASIMNSATAISGSGAFENLSTGVYKSSLPLSGSMNGMNPYSELYSLGNYPSVRGKAVDALTGTGPTQEFNMQSEDFPVLGGGGSDVNARAVNTANAAQQNAVNTTNTRNSNMATLTLDDALRNQNRNHNASRIIGMERPSNSNDPFFNVAAQTSQTSKLSQISQLSQLSGRGQYPGGSTSHLSQASLGMPSQPISLSHPMSSSANNPQFDVASTKAAAQNYMRQDQMAAVRQFGQQAKDDLPHLGHGHNSNVERMAPPGTTQNNTDNNSNQVGANSYLNYGTREGGSNVGNLGNLAAFAMANGPNFDGNTATANNTSIASAIAAGEDISKMNDALSGLQGLSLDASRRDRMQSTIPISMPISSIPAMAATPAIPSSSGVPLSVTAGMSEKMKKAAAIKEKETGELTEADLYGMRGLLKVLNPPAGKQEDVALLSLGLDLTQLGLDLNSEEPLYKNFRSPWDNYNKKKIMKKAARGVQGVGSAPVTPTNTATGNMSVGMGIGNEAAAFKLPACYYMSPPSLKGSHFGRFQLETLFYIFYSLPKDLLQALAAVELHNRSWRYHKTLKLWFTGAPGSGNSGSNGNNGNNGNNEGNRGAYIYFDISSWERRPFHDANSQFVQGLMSEDELRAIQIPPHMSNGA